MILSGIAPLLIHGVSGWLGNLACCYLAENHPGIRIIGTGRRPHPDFLPQSIEYYALTTNMSLLPLLKTCKPFAVLSFTRGETADDFRFHRNLISALNDCDGHYAFCSSFNAVDAHADHPHPEGEPPESVTGYGKFKSRCEKTLAARANSWAAFRFPAIHGFSPARITRTEHFLKQLQQGREIPVHRGVRQNRLQAEVLAAMMVELTLRRAAGTFHLGTVDDSEEIDFLRNLAERFGYATEQIVACDENQCNAVMIPGRVFQILGDGWRKTEADTLNAVANDPGLKKYHR